LAVRATRALDVITASRFVALGGGCGMIFLLLKACEWTVKIRAGLAPGSEDFLLYYFMLTGAHVVHLALGLLILALVWRELHARAPGLRCVEAGATYWHMVDVLWIVIFALLYLVR